MSEDEDQPAEGKPLTLLARVQKNYELEDCALLRLAVHFQLSNQFGDQISQCTNCFNSDFILHVSLK